MPRTHEPTQKSNPHRLTIHQHVIPVRTIERFASAAGMVDVQIGAQGAVRRLRPTNPIFTVTRAWNQRTERYMKSIEDAFQKLSSSILANEISTIPPGQMRAVNEYFSLWYHRARLRPPAEKFVQFNGVTGHDLTKDEEERYEKLGIFVTRKGGRMPMRDVVGLQLQAQIDQYAYQLKDERWAIIQATEGEFLVPDIPWFKAIPISPTCLLISNHGDGEITKANLVEINVAMLVRTSRYFFARNLVIGRDGVTDEMMRAAIKERDELQ